MPRKIPAAVWIVALIGGFMALGLYTFTATSFHAAQERVSQQRVHELDQALARYQLDTRRCPTTVADLVTMGYVSAAALKDTWKTNIALSCSPAGSFVRSAGRDKIFDTSDDLTSTVSGAGGSRR